MADTKLVKYDDVIDLLKQHYTECYINDDHNGTKLIDKILNNMKNIDEYVPKFYIVNFDKKK